MPNKPTKNLQNQRHGKESITNRMGQHKHAIHSTSTLTTGTEENVIQKQKFSCLNKHHPRKSKITPSEIEEKVMQSSSLYTKSIKEEKHAFNSQTNISKPPHNKLTKYLQTKTRPQQQQSHKQHKILSKHRKTNQTHTNKN